MPHTTTRSARVLAVLAAVGVAGFVAAQDRTPAQPDRQPPAKVAPTVDPTGDHFLRCAKACDDCARICDHCAEHCAKLIAEGHKHHLATLKTCQDCAAVCRAASAVVAKHGPFSDLICQACAEACKRCGDACEQHGKNNPTMKACADECRRCEKACREMLTHLKK